MLVGASVTEPIIYTLSIYSCVYFFILKFWFSTHDMILSDELPKSLEDKASPSPTYLLLVATFHTQPFSLSVSVVLFLHHGLPAPIQVNNTEPKSKYSLLALSQQK